jgi:hypothetical protein
MFELSLYDGAGVVGELGSVQLVALAHRSSVPPERANSRLTDSTGRVAGSRLGMIVVLG